VHRLQAGKSCNILAMCPHVTPLKKYYIVQLTNIWLENK